MDRIPKILLGYFIIVVIRALLFPFHLSTYDHLSLEEFKQEMSVRVRDSHQNLAEGMKPLCPSTFEGYKDHRWMEQWTSFSSNAFQDMDDNVAAISLGVTVGNVWRPTNCTAVHQVTIIVPVRDRANQLKTLVRHIHPFLQLQMVEYRIIVVEQVDQKPFNKGLLFNLGFLESLKKKGGTQCYIMHDVDLLPENLQNIYGCTKSPRHMSSSINSHRCEVI